jgi:hypothetical protein
MGIFSFLRKLFRRLVMREPSPSSRHSESIQSGTDSVTTLSFGTHPTEPSRLSDTQALMELKKKVQAICHPEFPFLHREYSPSSRIPCADFSEFIVERLKANDLRSVCGLMRAFVEANPGMGTDGSWVDDKVKGVVKAPLEQYIDFADPDNYYYLRAMWIIAEKEGSGREFWLTGSIPLFFAQALSPYSMELKPGMENLRKKANRFIREMRKDAPFWLDYPSFKQKDMGIPPLPPGECIDKVRSLTIGARLHLLFAVEAGGGYLPKLTDYALRNFGLHIPDTSREIIASELLKVIEAPGSLLNILSKAELQDACSQADVAFKKSWTKEKLLQCLIDHAPEAVKKLMADRPAMAPSKEHAECLAALSSRAQKLEPIFKVLCFV